MAPRGGLSGLALAEIAAGVILAWSGIANASIAATLRSVTAGKKPAADTGNQAITTAATVTTEGPITGQVAPAGGTVSSAGEAANQALGRVLAAAYGWGTGAEWTAFNNVVMAESGWNSTAQNPVSTAYGIGQFLDTTWATVGGTKTSNPATQITLMLKYVKQRYGDPIAAWSFHLANGYY